MLRYDVYALSLFSGVFSGKAAYSYLSGRVFRDRCLQEKERSVTSLRCVVPMCIYNQAVSSSPNFV